LLRQYKINVFARRDADSEKTRSKGLRKCSQGKKTLRAK
jgi:hypothetical protein